MARDKGTHWVITANRTDDGVPVYLDAGNTWTEALSAALTSTADEDKDAQLTSAAGQERIVCDPYAFRVVLDATGSAEATTARERIRGGGPTTPLRRDDAARA
ncbi:MAG: DUF2849 domain-containing protein [Nannocystaceae bacterium]|nr:DUF2849 domain-containing protein [Nannocystaceae bacterium]